MSTRRFRWLPAVLLLVAGVAGAGYALQVQATAALRREIELLQAEQRESGRLRAENERLKAEQAPAAEVERLRADRAALLRLRSEIDGMKRRVEERTVKDGGR